jgi:tape measure domain-containing protein
MSTIDEKVVTAKFDNKQFLDGVSSTLSAVDRLNKGMNFQGAGKGIESIATAAGQVTHKIDVMRIALVTAIGTIAHRATIAGERFVAAFTLDPVKAGFENYETQINAIQTILANTGLKGKKGLGQVNEVLATLNDYANKTVYNFSEMAKNIGTFTAAGVKLKPAAESIKGIANLAALSGSNSQQASTAMYQLSQAIAANQVKLQDWNSVVNAGIGGKVFQTALFNTGQALHTIKSAKVGESFEQWTKAGHTFRQSLQDGWITGKVLTQTLAGFTGDLTAAQLKSMGYNAQQIKQIREMGKTAVNAATQIKTLSQMGQALKEEVATAYSAIFKTIFGNITNATATFSALHNVLQNALTGPIYAVNKVLEGWSKLGGRTAAISAFKYAWRDLGAVLKPIKEAFRDIFPATTAKQLLTITVAVRNFFKHLKIGAESADALKRTFAGVFAILDIGRQIILGAIHFLGQLFAKAGEGRLTFLIYTASIGDFLVALDKSIKKGKGVTKFFDTLAAKIKPVIGYVEHLLGSFLSLFDGVLNDAPSQAKKVARSFDPLAQVGRVIGAVWGKVIAALHAVWNVAKAVGTFVGGLAAKVGTALASVFDGFHYEDLLKTINTALLGGIVLLLKKWVDMFVVQRAIRSGGLLTSSRSLSSSSQALFSRCRRRCGQLRCFRSPLLLVFSLPPRWPCRRSTPGDSLGP